MSQACSRKLDANHDGFVTGTEVEAMHQRMMGMARRRCAKEMADRGT